MAEDNSGHWRQSRAPCHNLSSARHPRALIRIKYVLNVGIKIFKGLSTSLTLVKAIGCDVCPQNHLFYFICSNNVQITKFNFLPLDGNSVPNIILGTDYGKSTKFHYKKIPVVLTIM